jgi:Peptidase A4 family
MKLFLFATVATLVLTAGLQAAPAGPATAGESPAPRFSDARQLAIDTIVSNLRVAPPMSRSEEDYEAASSGTYNWSGYIDSRSHANKTFSAVSATWSQPEVTCPTDEDQEAVFWVGLDGATDSTVEQDGTMAVCYLGTPTYYTWWEMYPTSSIEIVGGIEPGDTISASVSYAGGKYSLQVTDSTDPASSFTKSKKCGSGLTCARSSAEWIVETPSGSRGYYPLPNFGSWTPATAAVTGATASGSISAFPDNAIDMVSDAGYDLATAGSLADGGTSFTDTWENSY